MYRRAVYAAGSLAGIAAVTSALKVIGIGTPTTIALSYLLLVLFVAAVSELWMAVATSLVSMLCFNYFFVPPVGTLAVADPQNWVTLLAFLAVSIVASHLSAAARARERDAMERRRAAELSHQRAELSSALLASLSHDLRTPLTAIRTAIANLDEPRLGDDQRREQARVASDQIDRLTRHFEEILDMARIDAGAVQSRRAWTTPSEIIEAGVSRAATALAGRDVRIDAPEIGVEIDPRLTTSALAHLLENAARYSPAGPIVVRGWTEDGQVRFDVCDSGPGLQAAELERLFEPFYRGEQVRQRLSGTGMGLAIARGLLAAEGGRLWAANAASGGACFSIAIPSRSRAAAQVD